MDGFLIINKHLEVTSFDIVYKVKKMLNEKVGHTGTLDPLASGVLPILVGRGTQCAKYLNSDIKEYIAKVKLGKKTSTGDNEGEIIETKDIELDNLKKDKVLKIFKEMEGKQTQIPPMYSAIKVNGKKLYEYARQGKTVEVKPREIEIYKIELLNIDKENVTIEFKVLVSKGTYIRTLCETIGEKLNTVGFMDSLIRTKAGDFSIDNSISLEDLNNDIQNNLDKNFITIEKFFTEYKKTDVINLNDRKLELFLNGVKLTMQNLDGIYKIYNKNQFIGIGIVKDKLLKRDVVIGKE